MGRIKKTLTVAFSLMSIAFVGVSLAVGTEHLVAGNYWNSLTAATFAAVFFAIHIGYETEGNIYGLYEFVSDSLGETNEESEE